MSDDPRLPLLFTRDEALAVGMSRHQIAHRVRTHTWRPLRRAVYIEERRYAALSDREQHGAAVVATLMAHADGSVASHLSAALAYGWVLPLTGTGPVTLTADELLDATRRRLFQEKERRDRIVDLGAELTRWGTREIVRSPRTVLARIAAARQRGDAGRFTGRAAYLPSPAWQASTRRRVG